MPEKLGEGLKFKYEPIWEQAETDMKFHYWEEQPDGIQVLKIHTENFKLLKSIDELKAYIPLVKDKIIGFDTETTGLSYGEDKIVGFSLSLDAYSGFYVPIRHQEKLEIIKEVPKLDENGNPVILKSGKPSMKKETSYTLKESEENLNPKEALDVLYEILLNAKRVLMHNAEFDLNMLKFEGYDVNKIKFFDTLILPYIFDPEATGLAGLKALEKRVLGRTVPEFKDVLGKKAENFAFVAPSEGYVYACCDTSGVVGIFDKMFPVVKELLHQYKGNLTFDNITYNVLSKDNQMVQMFVDYYGHAKILIDRQKAIKYKEQLETEQKQTIKEIYDYFDAGMFNLSTSSTEFKKVMYSKKVITGVKTDKGGDSWAKPALDEMRKNIIKLKECLLNWKSIRYENGVLDKSGMGFQLSTLLLLYGDGFFTFGKESVNSLPIFIAKKVRPTLLEFWRTVKELYTAEESKYNILMKIQRNNSLNKALNSYVDKLIQVDECIMHYRLKGAKSGRLSSGNGSKTDKSKNTYYIDLNAQNLTKPASAYYSATQTTMDDPEGVLGWKFKPVEKDYAMSHLEDEYIVEGQDPNITIRGCLKAPEGRYVVSMDYDAEEYLLIAVLSRDSQMISNFLEGIDPHTATGIAIYGDQYDKSKRKKAKACIGEMTLLYTNHGLKCPSELVKEDKIIDEYGYEQEWVMTYDYGDLMEIQYSNGVTESYTPDHRIKVWTGDNIEWKQVQNLTQDDEVIQQVGMFKGVGCLYTKDYTWVFKGRDFKNSPKKFNICSNEFAYLGGLYLGDGHTGFNILEDKTKKPASIHYCIEPESTEKVTNMLETLGITPKKPRYIGKNQKIMQLSVSSIAWAQCITEFFGYTKGKFLNHKLLTLWSKEQLSYFISGLIDSDGTLRKDHIVISTTISEIEKAISIACSALGIKSAVRQRYSKYKGMRYSYKEVTLWDIPIDLPILNKRKKSSGKHGETSLGSWSSSVSFAKKEREFLRGKGHKYDSVLYNSWENVIEGHCKITSNIIEKTLNEDEQFPIKNELNPLRVVSKKFIKGNIYVIQTENEHYLTPCTISHNCNFLMNYQGGAYTLAQNLDIPLAEAEEIIHKYEQTFHECIEWKLQQVEKMYQSDGVVFNDFGRPRQFKGWINTIAKNSENYGTWQEKQDVDKASNRVKSAIERRVVSHIIQGTAGDILRLVLYKLYKRYFQNRDPHIDFMSTVHDEVNYTIDKEVTVDYVRELEDLMKFDCFDKRLPIKTSTDIGYTYGNMFPFVWEDENTKQVLIPKRVHHA